MGGHLLFSTNLFVYTTIHLAPVVDFCPLSYCSYFCVPKDVRSLTNRLRILGLQS